jgi:hypothetical protein
LSILRSFQFCAVGKKFFVNKEQRSNDVSTCPDIYSTKLSKTPPTTREDDAKDVDDDDIGEKMNKKVPFEDLSPIKIKLNYN